MTRDNANEAGTPSAGTPSEPTLGAGLISIAEGLYKELHPRGRGPGHAGLESSLERDWGFDSLTRAELLLRVEQAFSVHLPEHLLGEAETLRDLLVALRGAKGAKEAFDTVERRIIASETAESAPLDATTLTAVLEWHVERHGGRVHIVQWRGDGSETTMTYAELAARARAVGRGLRQAGLQPAERVAIMLPTGEDFFVAFFGILYAGGVTVPIYPPARPAQLEEHLKRQAAILRNAGAVFLVAATDMLALTHLLRLQVETLRRVVSIATLSRADGALPSKADAQGLALIQYTSGSTGDPKGVALSHANLLANIRAMGQAMAAGPRDVFVSWLPLYHDMGLIGAWLGSLYFAAPLVVMSPVTFLVRPEQWLWAIHRHRGTLSAAPNFAFELCLRKLDDAAIEGLDLGSLRMVANGAEAVVPETLRRFAARFAKYGFRPEVMAPVYGLAENAVGLAFPPLGRVPVIDRIARRALMRQGRARPAAPDERAALEFVACGRPLPGHEVRIIGQTGELGERQEGRLQFRGPSATAGYFNNPVKTRELFDGDWLNSGDLAYISDGDIFVTGRFKDIIIRAGRHIYPEEIEAAIGDIAGIRKGCVVVFGCPDKRTGTERIVVVAETRDRDAAILSALRAAIEERAGRLLDTPPEEVVLVPPRTIPKTSSGKLRRAAARELFEQGRLTRKPPSLWRQFLHLALAALGPQTRRLGRTAGELCYAAWWWSVVAALGTVLWPLVLALPRLTSRWRALRRGAWLAFRLMGIHLAVIDATPMPRRGIVIANHASYIDGLVLAAVLRGNPVFIAKKELETQFFAGRFLKALGALFVERSDVEGGVEASDKALRAAEAGQILVFFPEGTLSRAPGLLPFRLGAFVTAARQQLPVMPIILRGTRSILRAGQWFPRRGAVSVRVGEAIAPDAVDFAAAVRLRDRARAVVLAASGEPDMAET